MNIGYEQWHDGVGYDIDAIDHMSADEKRAVERLLVPRAANDWRDLEALDRLGTRRAVEAILQVRQAKDHEMRLRAHQYGPEPSTDDWESAILASLAVAQLFSGLINALNCAIEHPGPRVIDMLWQKVRDPGSGVAYHCAAALSCIAGSSESLYDDRHRQLFLRLNAQASPDRDMAIHELEEQFRGVI